MTRVVYIHYLGGKHDLETFLSNHFAVKKVFAGDDGRMIHQGMPVPYAFFDHHADVIVTSLPHDLHQSVALAMPHIPVVGIHGYYGMYASGAYRELWRSHAREKGIKVPHAHIHDPKHPTPLHELRHKVFLPSTVHVHGHEYGSHAVKTFPELQEYMNALSAPTHIERHLSGDHVHIISIRDFRDHDVYTTPLLHKNEHGYKVCNHIKQEQKNDAIRFVRELHQDLGLGPIAQFEFVIHHNDLYLVHIEPNPNHDDNSALHAGIESIGSSMKDLWKTIVENAKKRK